MNINIHIDGRNSTPAVYLQREQNARAYSLTVNYVILLKIIDIDILIYNTPELIILRDKILHQARPPFVSLPLAERLYSFRLMNVGKHTHKETPQRILKKALNVKGYHFQKTQEKIFAFSIYRLSEPDPDTNTTTMNFSQNNTAEQERRTLERLTGYTTEEIKAHALKQNQELFKSYDYLEEYGTLEIIKILIE